MSGTVWRRGSGVFDEFPKVLRGGGEENFISGAGEATQSEAVEFEYPFHMGESHLDFLAFIAGAFEGGRVSQGSDIVSNALINIAWHFALRRTGTAAFLQWTGAAVTGAGPVDQCFAVMNLARGLQKLAAGAGINVTVRIIAEVGARIGSIGTLALVPTGICGSIP